MGRRLRILLLAAIASFASCKPGMYDNSPGGPLELSQESILVDRNASTVHVGVTARENSWSVTGGEVWCEVSPRQGEKGIARVTVAFLANDDEGALTRETTLTFTSGTEKKTITVEQLATELVLPGRDPEYNVNETIHKSYLDKWYYSGETRTAPADYNQPYDRFFENYLTYLKRSELDGGVWAYNSERYLYSRIARNAAGEAVADTAPLNYGMEFDLADYDGRLVGRLLYVEEGSPAYRAGLRRGDWFYKVNDVQMGNWMTNTGWLQYNRLIDTLVRPVRGESPKLGMLTFRPLSGTLVDEGRSVTLSPENFRTNPILHTQFIGGTDLSGNETRTGYMVYNRFDPRYRDELITRFAELKSLAGGESMTHFVLDLRYNKSGSVEMAELVGDLLVPASAAGKVFSRYVFDGGEASAADREALFTPHPEGAQAPVIFILTSKFTSGAAELLINALAGIDEDVQLVVIGDVTEGMNVGMVRQGYRVDDVEYDMWIAAFRCLNAAGTGAYEGGFTPNGGEIDEWVGTGVEWPSEWGWKGWIGATEDPLLKRAMDLVTGSASMPASPVQYSSPRQRTGYPRLFCVPADMTMDVTD